MTLHRVLGYSTSIDAVNNSDFGFCQMLNFNGNVFTSSSTTAGEYWEHSLYDSDISNSGCWLWSWANQYVTWYVSCSRKIWDVCLSGDRNEHCICTYLGWSRYVQKSDEKARLQNWRQKVSTLQKKSYIWSTLASCGKRTTHNLKRVLRASEIVIVITAYLMDMIQKYNK